MFLEDLFQWVVDIDGGRSFAFERQASHLSIFKPGLAMKQDATYVCTSLHIEIVWERHASENASRLHRDSPGHVNHHQALACMKVAPDCGLLSTLLAHLKLTRLLVCMRRLAHSMGLNLQQAEMCETGLTKWAVRRDLALRSSPSRCRCRCDCH